MKPEEELMSGIKEAFKLVPALQAIHKCKSKVALTHLKTIIDNRIAKLSINPELDSKEGHQQNGKYKI